MLSSLLAAHAAKSGVCKLLMRMEPVGERAPQHARCGARRPAFQDEVLAIEEIGGVSAVERKWCECGERGKFSGSPLTPIAEHAVNTEGALALGKYVHRGGAPACEIEIAKLLRRPFLAPRVLPLFALRGSVCRALPLGFSEQRLPCPSCVSVRFRVTHIDGPIQRQWDIVEHRAIQPAIAFMLPESRMRDSAFGFPVPVCMVVTVSPEHLRFISSRVDELEILLVPHLVLIDGERRNVEPVGFAFLSPPPKPLTPPHSHPNP